MIQLYGQFDGYHSIAIVSRAIAQMLRAGRFNACAYPIGAMRPSFDGIQLPIGLNNEAQIGICVGAPPVGAGWLSGHDHKILITVCEASRIPNAWVRACEGLDLIVVPSEFCKLAFANSGVRAPIMIVPHGVSREVIVGRKDDLDSEFIQLLHVTGALSYPWRKGTSSLLVAMTRVPENVFLTIKTPSTQNLQQAIKKLGLKNVFLWEDPFTPRQMKEFICTFHAVIQPSRAEGFGMVPLEARCLGTPAILTTGTGHDAHFVPGVDVPIEVGPDAPIQTFDNDQGSAPTVSPGAVQAAILAFLGDVDGWRAKADSWAVQRAGDWSWERVLTPLAKVLRARHDASSVVLGGESSLRGI